MPTPQEPRKTSAIVIIVGNEILDGYTLDTNSHYLSETLRERGILCTARHTIRDDKAEIKQYLKAALVKRPDYLFVSGGLGPTHDDVTFEAVAEALHRRLVLSEEAIRNIQDRLDLINRILPKDKRIEMNEASRKMALVPEGTEVITNKAGTAPAVYIRVGPTLLFLLPGVPRELKWITENAILGKYIKEEAQDLVVELEVLRGESNFATILKEIQEEHPNVKIGSYPQSGRVLLRVAGREEEVRAVEKKITELILSSNPKTMNWER